MSISTQFSSSNPSKKYLKTSHANRETRISNLPDDVIGHILSRLPTKDAVRTCILSRDWEYKWTSIYNIDIDDTAKLSSKQRSKKASFVNIVERILLFSQNVKSFRLSCWEKYDSNRMTAWISAVLRRNVKSFEVTYLHAGIVLPRTLLNCTTLKILKLKLPCTFKIPTVNCFPNLVDLQFEGVEILNKLSYTHTLKLTFPKLKTCELVRCKWLNVNFVEIYAPALTKFSSKPPCDAQVNDYSININGARLKWLLSSGDLLENFILTRSSAVVVLLTNTFREGNIHLLENNGLQVRMLLRELSSLKGLILSSSVAKAIDQSKCRGVPLRFSKLERLFLSAPCYTEALFELLRATTFLKFLQIDVKDWDNYNYEAIDSLPSCIISHLKEVRFKNFVGKTPQLKLAKFLLKNATELKKVHLCGSSRCQYSTEKKNEIVEQLSNMPKLSACLTIVVT